MKNRVTGALIGLACGDAVGTTLEFKPRGSFEPITDMVGGGPFNLDVGQWTDDMSMALCLGYSLIDQQGFDPADQMDRYCNWYQHGYMSSTGICFDIGNTVAYALNQYLETNEPFSGRTDEMSSGNGSLMRLAPIPMYYRDDLEACIHYAGESSRTTHGSEECVESCRLFASLIYHAFHATSKEEIFTNNHYTPTRPKVIDIAKLTFKDKAYGDLTGSGYVIESFESALWCFIHANNFEEAILLAANLGNDADTTAAICGQIAGAFYGADQIPNRWKAKLTMSNEIEQLALDLFRSS